MATKIKGYLIDPIALTISVVQLDRGDINQMYKLLGVESFDCARINAQGDAIFVDDEGLLKSQPANNFFQCDWYPTPLAGKGLVLGVDSRGNSTDPKVSIEDMVAHTYGISWLMPGVVAERIPFQLGE